VDSAQVSKGQGTRHGEAGAQLLEKVPIISSTLSRRTCATRPPASASMLVAMREITERGRIPLRSAARCSTSRLAGSLNELPEADPMIRLVIDTMARSKAGPAVHARLAAVDPRRGKLAPKTRNAYSARSRSIKTASHGRA